MKHWFHIFKSCRGPERPGNRVEPLPAARPVAPHPSLPAAPLAPEWEPAHQAAWSSFLYNTAAGVALMGRLRAIEALTAVQACAKTIPSAERHHAAGRANGWTECRLWLESLSRSSRVTDEQEQAQPSAGAETADTNNDKQAPGEAQLLERLSP